MSGASYTDIAGTNYTDISGTNYTDTSSTSYTVVSGTGHLSYGQGKRHILMQGQQLYGYFAPTCYGWFGHQL